MNAALLSARAAVAGGRIGLPWNVQADLFVAGSEPVPAEPFIDNVRELIGLALVRTAAIEGRSGVTVLRIDFERNLTATLAFGPLPAATEPPGTAVVHRYRISGSHGFLIVDATRPGIDVHTKHGVTRRWVDT
jgi:hypothetical protein